MGLSKSKYVKKIITKNNLSFWARKKHDISIIVTIIVIFIQTGIFLVQLFLQNKQVEISEIQNQFSRIQTDIAQKQIELSKEQTEIAKMLTSLQIDLQKKQFETNIEPILDHKIVRDSSNFHHLRELRFFNNSEVSLKNISITVNHNRYNISKKVFDERNTFKSSRNIKKLSPSGNFTIQFDNSCLDYLVNQGSTDSVSNDRFVYYVAYRIAFRRSADLKPFRKIVIIPAEFGTLNGVGNTMVFFNMDGLFDFHFSKEIYNDILRFESMQKWNTE